MEEIVVMGNQAMGQGGEAGHVTDAGEAPP
jgi:hypothetical protein